MGLALQCSLFTLNSARNICGIDNMKHNWIDEY